LGRKIAKPNGCPSFIIKVQRNQYVAGNFSLQIAQLILLAGEATYGETNLQQGFNLNYVSPNLY
jgi:hypothetical protein